MSYEPQLTFLNSKILGHPDSLEGIIDILQQLGYSIQHIEVAKHQDRIAYWHGYNEQIQRELTTAYENQWLKFTAKNKSQDFEVVLHLNWKEYVHISATCYQTALFTRQVNNPPHYARIFLNFGKALYEYLKPDFGWQDICEPAGYTWYDDINTLKIPHIYWANFFSPPFVKKYGKEKLLSGPAWLVEELKDGGILYVIAEAPGYSYGKYVSPKDVARYLGI